MKTSNGVKLQKSGLDIELISGNLEFPENISYGEKIERRARDLSPVLYANPPEADKIIYKVWKNIRRVLDESKIDKARLSYDITVICSGKIGRELPKTFGHYHSEDPGGTGYPELYEVLRGQAWFLIQKSTRLNPKKIEEIYLVEAEAGEKAIIPPNFGHVAINPGGDDLVLANWRDKDFSYDYETYSNLRGGGYYLIESKNGNSVEFEKNNYYDSVPEIKKIFPKPVPEFGIGTHEPAYSMINKPERLNFLRKPESYREILTINKCFK